MARKPNPKAGRFEVTATPDEIRAWIVAAFSEDRTLGNWLRRVANAAAYRAERGPRKGMKP